MNFFGVKTAIFSKEGDIFSFFSEHLEKIQPNIKENSVIIISSKIVALAQGRVVKGTKKDIEKWVEKESEKYWHTAYENVFFALKDGMLVANAGIDASNAEEGTLILLPENMQAFADSFREQVKKKFTLKNIGVVISDSRCTPMRAGVTGIGMAWSGFEGVQDERGKKDLFGKELHITQNAVADNLASAGELIMGNADESIPFVICENAPVRFTDIPQDPKLATFPPEDDLFGIFWQKTV